MERQTLKQEITTAVFPVAGLGTRFLPVTKAGPKEMLPIVDKPLIQYVVEEALAVGIKQLIFVTTSSKRAIEDYFDRNYELECHLQESGKQSALTTLQNIVPSDVSIVYVRQPRPLGLGDAVLRTKDVIGQMPFAVLLADDIMDLGAEACLQNMLEIFAKTQSSVLAIERISPNETNKYGIVSLAKNDLQPNRIVSIVEKPHPKQALSNLAVTGRYILTPRIFATLEKTQKGTDGEIQLTDAINALLYEESIIACPIRGRRFDCGSRMGFLEATLSFALKRPELEKRLKAYLTEIIALQKIKEG